jgi:protein-L-isoaspartate(D-aspartate) O-methyltransferase
MYPPNGSYVRLQSSELACVFVGRSATLPYPELPGIMVIVSDPEQLVQAVAAEGVGDPRVLDAVRAVPRAGFVPPHLAGRAYQDEPLPIPRGQVTTQPSLVARMVEALGLTGSEQVLEVGAGYGWQTALLARLCGFVWAVERFADVAEAARENLARFGVANAEVVEGDGTEGLSEHAPYDTILVAAAFPSVPRPLEEQLAVGGRLVQPVGPGGREEVVLFVKGPRNLGRVRVVAGASFVKLHGAHAFPEE